MEHHLSNDERELEEREREREREQRKNRFAYSGADTPRSASQPPSLTPTSNVNGEGFHSTTTAAMQIYGSSASPVSAGRTNANGNGNGNGNRSGERGSNALSSRQTSSSQWAAPGNGRIGASPTLGRSSSISTSIRAGGFPSSLPQSSSFSERVSGSGFANAIRETHSFPSTFEDDESEVPSDGDFGFASEAQQQQQQFSRGRHFISNDTRSRSQSLATATASRPLPIGSPPTSAGGGGHGGLSSGRMGMGWTLPPGMSGPLSIPGRFGDIKVPGPGSGPGSGGRGGSRYGSLEAAFSHSPVIGAGSSPSPTAGLHVNAGTGNGCASAELTNISPLARDVGQILLDEDPSWNGVGYNGGDSGATSRRHSVSIIQPARRGIVGFNAPDSDDQQGYYGAAAGMNGHGYGHGHAGGITLGGGELGNGSGGGVRGGALAISDDELVSLNSLNLNQNQPRTRSSYHGAGGPSQPASLPIYAPLSRNTHEGGSFAESLGISVASTSRRMLRTPSESGYSVSSAGGGGGSPPQRDVEHSPALESAYLSRQQQQQQTQLHHLQQTQQQQRYVPSQGFQYIPEDELPAPNPPHLSMNSIPQNQPPSPTFMRNLPSGGLGPNQSFMMPLSPTRGQQIQFLQQQQQQQQQQIGGAGPVLQRRASQSEGFVGFGAGAGAGAGAGLGGAIGIVGHAQHMPPPSHQAQQSQSHQQPQHQQQTLSELGRGIPLHAVPDSWHLYIVEFKAGRTDLFYVADPSSLPGTTPNAPLRVGDLVIVEADRGKDLGKVVNDTITAAEVEAFQRQQQVAAAHAAAFGLGSGSGSGSASGDPTSPDSISSPQAFPGAAPSAPPPPHGKKDINPKKIYAKATAADAQLLVTKHQDEAKALALCQSKVKQKKLPMEVIDAEYQWDRRKLTFYFIAEKRIDFRELVRELFRLYKTRIWMASLQGPTSPE